MTINVTALQHQLEAQKRTINALQNENHWLQDVIFNPSFNEIDMRLLVKNTPREMRMGLCTEFPEKKIYLPDQAEAAHCSPKVASQHLRLIAKKTGAFSYRPERDEETGNTRVVLQPLPPAETPADLRYERVKRGGSDWINGQRVKRCKDCGSANLAKVSQIICVDCGSAQTEKTYKPVNDPDCHIDTDPEDAVEAMGHYEEHPDCHIDTDPDPDPDPDPVLPNDPDCHIDTDPEISKLPSISVYTVGVDSVLRSRPIWCCHREKVPYNAKPVRSPQKAKSNDPTSWSTYDQAQATYQESQQWKHPYDGIGFMCDGSFTVIDYDHCITDGQIDELATCQIQGIDSYAEISYSGTGVHQITLATLPRNIKQPGIEMYDHARFITWTGKHLAGTPETIERRQAEVDALFVEIAPPVQQRTEQVPAPCTHSDERILEKGKNDIKFMDLFRGQCVGHYYQKKDGSPDYSRADLALCQKISYWGAGGDVSTIDRIFRQSGLYREKWERDDYRMNTINLALGQHWQEAS